MMSYLVSIVIPTYNYGHLITDTIECLIKQSFENWEAIIVDDGSTDSTQAILTHFLNQDNRLKYYYKENGGLASARNFGISKATGQFLQFLDADDLISEKKLEFQLKSFDQDASIGVSYTSANYFLTDQPQVFYSDIYKQQKDWIPKINASGYNLLIKLLNKNIMPVSSALIKRSALAKEKYFDVKLKSLEDWNFWIEIGFDNVKFSYYDNPLAFTSIRIHKTSMSYNQKKMFAYDLIVRNLISKKLDELQPIYLKFDEIERLKNLNCINIASSKIYNGEIRNGIIKHFNSSNFNAYNLLKDLLRFLKYKYIGSL